MSSTALVPGPVVETHCQIERCRCAMGPYMSCTQMRVGRRHVCVMCVTSHLPLVNKEDRRLAACVSCCCPVALLVGTLKQSSPLRCVHRGTWLATLFWPTCIHEYAVADWHLRYGCWMMVAACGVKILTVVERWTWVGSPPCCTDRYARHSTSSRCLMGPATGIYAQTRVSPSTYRYVMGVRTVQFYMGLAPSGLVPLPYLHG